MSSQPAADSNVAHTAPHIDRCIACESTSVEPFFEIERVPAQCNVLWRTREEALTSPTGMISLGFCVDCGHIANFAFDPGIMEYTQRYENSLHFSDRFQAFLNSLIKDLDNAYSLQGKRVIDVGCGKGEFLTALCEQTGCFGFGFDRSYEPEHLGNGVPNPQAQFIVDFYGEQYSDYPADLITCRHVLEHIDDPIEFVSMIRRTIGQRAETNVFFEVPNALYTIQQMGIWDIIYEHVSYFTGHSLAALFERCGFDVTGQATGFDGQFLTLNAAPSSKSGAVASRDRGAVESLADDIAAFRHRYERKLRDGKRLLSVIRNANRRTVIWGSGSKGVTFLNALGVYDEVHYAVDINPRKTGMFVSGTGQRIVQPEFLRGYRPDLIILMNPIYEAEVRESLSSVSPDAEIVHA